MEYEEYMASLTEQIHDKRAKQLVVKEIRNHIEEQAECYVTDGMDHAGAIREAVRQMGNPVDTGMELNKIHKPKMPWAMLGLVVFLMLAGIVMQAVVFTEGATSRWNLNWDSLLPKTIVYNLIGFAVILLLLYVDYNFIAKYAYGLYAFYLFGLVAWLVAVNVNIWTSPSITTYYGLQMLFPIVFAGIVYRNRNRGWRGIGICLSLGITEFAWYVAGWEILGDRWYSYYPALAESILIMLLVLVLAIWKGIFGKDCKKQCIFLVTIVLALTVLSVIILSTSTGMGTYILRRLRNIFTAEDSAYLNVLLQESLAQADWLGGGVFLGGEPENLHYTTLLLNGVFTYFGKLAGVVVVAVFVLFIGMALKMSLKQSNRIGFLIGVACSASILIRFVAYAAINMGYALWWTTLVPFFSYGKVGAVMNGIYIGLILCVYRNSNILHEKYVGQKRLPKIRVTIE